ncbi:glycosyltransferase family 4 protein [Gluconobacter japonicus]|uniref:glycosyltransferase family 4 protein n=1 Tax=Gluconobacter japonicus TaxID=376620 RepID=UPI0007813D04|nr:glycosyltransferase family 4 protein [Gluconobacter japonicus]KXV20503.1 lipopolysaccharide biosynthesis protein [Gluconobacter japonicus]
MVFRPIMTIRSPVILQVLPALTTGGLERGAIEIAAAITQAGGKAIVASKPGPLLVQLRHAGAMHVPLDLKSKSPFAVRRRARDLQKLIREQKVDLVHARSRIPAWSAWLACRREKIPFVTTWHGVHEAGWWGKKLYNSVLARGTRVIAISQYIAGRLSGQYGVEADRLRTIPRGADPLLFDPAAISGERIQKLAEAWTIPYGAHVILMPARLTAWKGQRVLVEALALLKQTVPEPWICVLAGPETDRKFAHSLGNRVKELGLEEHVRFVGTCQDMPAACALATVVVAPSLRPEPFGRTLVEAQMMGKPVIGTAQGAMMETVLPGQTGLVVPPNTPQALAEALAATLLMDNETRGYLAENARQHALQNYTIQQMQSATLGVYDELLGTHLRASFDGQTHDT